MDKEQKALKDFMGDLGGNTEEISLNLGTEEEVKTEPEAPVEEAVEEKLPFHKDPKVQRYIERQLEKKLKDFQPSREEQFVKEVGEDDPLIDAFSTIIGNDTPEKVNALKALKRSMADVQDKAAEKAYARFAEEQRQAQAEESKAVEELSDALERIEENFSVDLSSNSTQAKKTRNEFLDFLGRISPKNENGEVTEYADIDEAFETFQSMRKPEVKTQAKDIASRSLGRSTVDATQAPTKRITFENWRELAGLEN